MRVWLALPLLMLLACEREEVAAPTAEQEASLNEADALLDNLAADEPR